jgi:hypothetical protein
MLGRAAVAIWFDTTPDVRAELEDWHTHEHMPERLRIPGFLRGTRWIAQSGEPAYFVLYEAARLAVLAGGPYLERLNDPTPWSRRMMRHHHHMTRSACRVRASVGAGVAQAIATLRFSKARISKEAISDLPRRKGLTAAHLLHAQAQPAAPTEEQTIRGVDAAADRVLLIGGYDPQAVEAAARELAPRGAALGLYRLAYCLTSRDKP